MSDSQQPRFCGRCGAARPEGASFCPGCGTALGPAPEPSSETPEAKPKSSGPWVAAGVMAAFMATGAGIFWLAAGTSGDVARAVPGRPTPAVEATQESARDIEFPEEILTFLEELQEAAAASPENIEAWQKLARAQFRASQLNRSYTAQAEQSLERLLDLDANNLEGLRMAGNLEYTKNDFAAAQGYYERYLELEPGDPHVLTDLGSVLLFQDQTETAKKIYADVLKEHPEFVQAHFNLAIALHAQGDSEGALESLELARKHASAPEYRERIDQYIRTVKSGAAHGEVAPTGGSGPDSNASSAFQSRVDRIFIQHNIVGRKITSIEWHDATNASVYLDGFPMDKMPPVMRNKFKSTMNEQIMAASNDTGTETPVLVKLVDKASNTVMDSLDGEEFVGAFDEQAYQ